LEAEEEDWKTSALDLTQHHVLSGSFISDVNLRILVSESYTVGYVDYLVIS
jgi:hypothetical protein